MLQISPMNENNTFSMKNVSTETRYSTALQRILHGFLLQNVANTVAKNHKHLIISTL